METKAKSNALPFKIDQYVICPLHGLGVVESIESRSIKPTNPSEQEEGVKKEFYKIKHNKKKMSSLFPIDNIKQSGIRSICSKEIGNRVFGVLEKPFRTGRGMWSKRAQEYDAKIYSGSILLTAEVVRDLFSTSKDPNRSYSERIIYETALSRITSELSVVFKTEESKMEEKIINILTKSIGKSIPKQVIPDNDDFNDDLELYSDDDDSDDGS